MYPPAQIQQEGLIRRHKIRCVLVHDHVLLRQGLRRLLEDEPDVEVVAEAGNMAEALRTVFEHRPEIVITDAQIFECAADKTERLLMQESPQTKVLFLAEKRGDDSTVERRTDEASCAVRHTSVEQLLEMVRGAHSGDRSVVREMPRREPGESSAEGLLPRKRILTAREREVVKLLAEGRTVRSAAGILGLSVKTVDAHKFNLMRKLGIHNKAELVMWAIQKRVVKVPVNY